MPEVERAVIWKDRLVKVVDWCVHISAKGDFDDFEFCRVPMTADSALGFCPGCRVYEVEAVGDELLIRASGGTFVLRGEGVPNWILSRID